MYQSNIIVEHIVNLTSQRDREVLAISLLKSINSLLLCSQTEIISINKKGDISSYVSCDNNHYVVNDPTILIDDKLISAIKIMNESSQHKYTLKNKSRYSIIYLFHHDRNNQQFLVLNLREKIGEIQSRILSGTLSIYNNFITLLNESQTDELTGLSNRKTFDSAISKVFDSLPKEDGKVDNERRSLNKGSLNSKNSYWLAIIDSDNFKRVNDEYGHLYGDEILIHLAQIIRSSFRQEDLQFRFGGEEFVILLSAEDKKKCIQVVERFRRKVEAYKFPSVDKVTVSIGIVEFKRGTFHLTLIDYADQALYESKKQGKNIIVFFEEMQCKGRTKSLDVEGML